MNMVWAIPNKTVVCQSTEIVFLVSESLQSFLKSCVSQAGIKGENKKASILA